METAIANALTAQSIPQYRSSAAQLGTLSTDARVATQLQHLGGTAAACRILLSTGDAAARRFSAFALSNITSLAGLSVAADGHGLEILSVMARGDVEDDTKCYAAAACCNLLRATGNTVCLGTDEAVCGVLSRLVHPQSHLILSSFSTAFVAAALGNPSVAKMLTGNATSCASVARALIGAGMGPYHPTKVSVLIALTALVAAGGAPTVSICIEAGVIDLAVACCIDTSLPQLALRYGACLISDLAASPAHRTLMGKRTVGVLLRNITMVDDAATVQQCLLALSSLAEDGGAAAACVSGGCFDAILAMFSADYLRLAWASAIRLLSQICRSDEGALSCTSHPVFRAVLSCLSDEGEGGEELRTMAAICVSNASSFSDILPILLELTAVEALSAGVVIHNRNSGGSGIGMRASLIAALHLSAPPALHGQFLQQRGYALLPVALAAPIPQARVLALGVLLNLARNTASHTAICRAGGPAIVVNLMDDPTLEVQQAAIVVARALLKSPLGCGALTGAGVFQALGRALRHNHPDPVVNEIIAVLCNLTADVRTHARFLGADLVIAMLNIVASPTVSSVSLQLAATTVANLNLSEMGRALVGRCLVDAREAHSAAVALVKETATLEGTVPASFPASFASSAAFNVQRLTGEAVVCLLRLLVNLASTEMGCQALSDPRLIQAVSMYAQTNSGSNEVLATLFLYNLSLNGGLSGMTAKWCADVQVSASKRARNKTTTLRMRTQALQLLASMLSQRNDALEGDALRYVVESVSTLLSSENGNVRSLASICVLNAFQSPEALEIFGPASPAASVAVANLSATRDASIMGILASTFCVWSFSPSMRRTLFATNTANFCGFLLRCSVALDPRLQRLVAATMANLFEASAIPFALQGHVASILSYLVERGADLMVVTEALRGLTAASSKPNGIGEELLRSSSRVASVLMGPSKKAALQALRCVGNLSMLLAAEAFMNPANRQAQMMMDYFGLALKQQTSASRLTGDVALLQYRANAACIQKQPMESLVWDTNAHPFEIAAAFNSCWKTPPKDWKGVPELSSALDLALASDNYPLKIHALNCLKFLCFHVPALARAAHVPGLGKLVEGFSAISDGVRDHLLEVLANMSASGAEGGGAYFNDRTLRLAWNEACKSPSPKRREVAMNLLANIASVENKATRRILALMNIIPTAGSILTQLEGPTKMSLMRLVASVGHEVAFRSAATSESVGILINAIIPFCKSQDELASTTSRLTVACLFDAFTGSIALANGAVLMQSFETIEGELHRSLIRNMTSLRAASAFVAMGASHPCFEGDQMSVGRILCKLVALSLTDTDSSILLLQTLRRGISSTGSISLIDTEEVMTPLMEAASADSSCQDFTREFAALAAECASSRLMKTSPILLPMALFALRNSFVTNIAPPVNSSSASSSSSAYEEAEGEEGAGAIVFDKVSAALWGRWIADSMLNPSSHALAIEFSIPDELLAIIRRWEVAGSRDAIDAVSASAMAPLATASSLIPVAKDAEQLAAVSNLLWQVWRSLTNFSAIGGSAEELVALGALPVTLSRLQSSPSFVLLPAYSLASNLVRLPIAQTVLESSQLRLVANVLHLSDKEFGSAAAAVLSNTLYSMTIEDASAIIHILPAILAALVRCKPGEEEGFVAALNLVCQLETHALVVSFENGAIISLIDKHSRTVTGGSAVGYLSILQALCCSRVGRAVFSKLHLEKALLLIACGFSVSPEARSVARKAWLNLTAGDYASNLRRVGKLPACLPVQELIENCQSNDLSTALFSLFLFGNFQLPKSVVRSTTYVNLVSEAMTTCITRPDPLSPPLRMACTSAIVSGIFLQQTTQKSGSAAVAILFERVQELTPYFSLDAVECLVALLSQPAYRFMALRFGLSIYRCIMRAHVPQSLRLAFLTVLMTSQPWRYLLANECMAGIEEARLLLGTELHASIACTLPTKLLSRVANLSVAAQVQGLTKPKTASSTRIDFFESVLASSNLLASMLQDPCARLTFGSSKEFVGSLLTLKGAQHKQRQLFGHLFSFIPCRDDEERLEALGSYTPQLRGIKPIVMRLLHGVRRPGDASSGTPSESSAPFSFLPPRMTWQAALALSSEGLLPGIARPYSAATDSPNIMDSYASMLAPASFAYSRLAAFYAEHPSNCNNPFWWTDDRLFSVARDAWRPLHLKAPSPDALSLADALDCVTLQPLRWRTAAGLSPRETLPKFLRMHSMNPLTNAALRSAMRSRQQRRLAFICASLQSRSWGADPLATLLTMHASRSHSFETSFSALCGVLNLVTAALHTELGALRATSFLPLQLTARAMTRRWSPPIVLSGSADVEGHDDVWSAAACGVARGTLVLRDAALGVMHAPTPSHHNPTAAAIFLVKMADTLRCDVWGTQAVLALHRAAFFSGPLDHDVFRAWESTTVKTAQAAASSAFLRCLKTLTLPNNFPPTPLHSEAAAAAASASPFSASVASFLRAAYGGLLETQLPWFPSPSHQFHRFLHRPQSISAITRAPETTFAMLSLFLRLCRFDTGGDPRIMGRADSRYRLYTTVAGLSQTIPLHIYKHVIGTALHLPHKSTSTTSAGQGLINSLLSQSQSLEMDAEDRLADLCDFLIQLPGVTVEQLAPARDVLRSRISADAADIWTLSQISGICASATGRQEALGSVETAQLLGSPFPSDRLAAAESLLSETRQILMETQNAILRDPLSSTAAGDSDFNLFSLKRGATGSSAGKAWKYGDFRTSKMLVTLSRDAERAVNDVGSACLINLSGAQRASDPMDMELMLRQAALVYSINSGDAATAGLHIAGLLPLHLTGHMSFRAHAFSKEALDVLTANPYAARISFIRHALSVDRSFKTDLDRFTRKKPSAILENLRLNHPMLTIETPNDCTANAVHIASLAMLVGTRPQLPELAGLVPFITMHGHALSAFTRSALEGLLLDAAMLVMREQVPGRSSEGLPPSCHVGPLGLGTEALLNELPPSFAEGGNHALDLLRAFVLAETARVRPHPYPLPPLPPGLPTEPQLPTSIILSYLFRLEEEDSSFSSPYSATIRTAITRAAALGSGQTEDVSSVAIVLLCQRWAHTFVRYTLGPAQVSAFQDWVLFIVRKLRKTHFASVPAAAAAIASLQKLLGVKWHSVTTDLLDDA